MQISVRKYKRKNFARTSFDDSQTFTTQRAPVLLLVFFFQDFSRRSVLYKFAELVACIKKQPFPQPVLDCGTVLFSMQVMLQLTYISLESRISHVNGLFCIW